MDHSDQDNRTEVDHDLARTLDRLVNVSKGLPITDAALGGALKDLREFPPWSGVGDEQLAREFRAAANGIGPDVAQYVKAIFDLELAETKLGVRRANLYMGDPGGDRMLAWEREAYARTLYSMVADKKMAARPATRGLDGYVPLDVEVSVTIERAGLRRWTRIDGEAHSDGLRTVLSPMIEECPEPDKFILVRGQEEGLPLASVVGTCARDASAPELGRFVVAALDYPATAGERIGTTCISELYEAAATKKNPLRVWWDCLGTEKQVSLIICAPNARVSSTSAPRAAYRLAGEQKSTPIAVEATPCVPNAGQEKDIPEVEWRVSVEHPARNARVMMWWDLDIMKYYDMIVRLGMEKRSL